MTANRNLFFLLNYDVPDQNSSSENILFILDRNGKFLDVKYKDDKLLLFPPDQFIGKYLHDVLPESASAGLKTALNAVNLTGSFQTYNYELVLDGEVKFFDTILIPQPDGTILSVVRDSTRTIAYQKLLIQRKKHFKRILSNIRDLISETDIRGNLTFVSPSHLKILGYQENEMLGKFTGDFVHPDDLLQFREQLLGLLGGKPFYGELRFRHKNGHYVNIEISCEILKEESGSIAGFVAVSRDITEKKLTQIQLMESEARYRMLFENSPVGISIAIGENIVNVNKAYYNMFGYSSAEELIGQPVTKLAAPEERPYISEGILSHEAGNCIVHDFHTTGFRKDGSRFPIHMAVDHIRISEGEASIGFVIDMTEAASREEKIKSSLLEKEILLKEIHHRVKNNLQIISSLLSLQSDLLSNKNYLEAFNDSRTRIRSMAIIHEKLYQTNNFASIDFCEYAFELISFLKKTYGSLYSDIRIEHDFDRVIMEIDPAITCGLILNELISNAFKYAFSADRQGKLICRIKTENGSIILAVKDNGPGIPESKCFDNTETLGLMLVKSLAIQLKGTIEMRNNEGAEFTVKFPYSEPEAGRHL